MVKIMDWLMGTSTGSLPLQGLDPGDERRSSPKLSPKGSSSRSSNLEMPGTFHSIRASRDGSSEPNPPKPSSALLIEESEQAEQQTFSVAERPFPDLDPLAFNNEDEIYTESRPWHDGQTGDLTREEFLTFKKLIDEDYKKIRLDQLEMLKRADEERNDLRSKIKQAETAKERLAQKMEAEKEELKADIADLQKDLDECRDRVNEPRFLAAASLFENSTLEQIQKLKDLLDNNPEQTKQLEEEHEQEIARLQKRRGPLREPEFTSDNIDNDSAALLFLYDNPEDNAIEQQISKHLLATETLLRTKDPSKKNLDVADEHTFSAYVESTKLNYEPLEARCAFWNGRVAYVAKNYDAAEFAFRASRSAVGHYFEGLHVEAWLAASRAKKTKRAELLKDRHSSGIRDDAPWSDSSDAEEELKDKAKDEPKDKHIDIESPTIPNPEKEEEETPQQRPKFRAARTLPSPHHSSILVRGKAKLPDFGLSGLAGILGISRENSFAEGNSGSGDEERKPESVSVDSSSRGDGGSEQKGEAQAGWQTANALLAAAPVEAQVAGESPANPASSGNGSGGGERGRRGRGKRRRKGKGRNVSLAKELEGGRLE